MTKPKKVNKFLRAAQNISRVLCVLLVVSIVSYIIVVFGKWIEARTDNFESCWEYESEYYITTDGKIIEKEI